MSKMTVVMPFLDEGQEPIDTILSIAATCSADELEIIAIDDCSIATYTDFAEVEELVNLQVVRNQRRIGAAPCIDMGVAMAKYDAILIIDGHMRFRNDNWKEKMLGAINDDPQAIYCTTCVALSREQMDMSKAKTKYYGSSLQIVPESGVSDEMASGILEPRWINKKTGELYEIPCVLGANYFFSKRWFMRLGGLMGLVMWGSIEPFISMKSWMFGGRCKLLTSVEIGHMFRNIAPYATNKSHIVFNKLLVMDVLADRELFNLVLGMIVNGHPKYLALTQLMQANNDIETETARISTTADYSFRNACLRAGVFVPTNRMSLND